MVIGKLLPYGAVFNLTEDCGVEKTDSELMLAAAEGDMEAYNLLYKKFRKPLYNYILRHVLNKQSAEDIFQDTFLRVYKSRKSYKPTAKFSVYLYTIAHRLCINYAKKKKRWGFVRQLSEMIFGNNREDSPTLEDTIADEDLKPLEIISNKEMGEVLTDALEKISEKHRTAFMLFEIQGFKYNEIADITGSNIGTVKSRLNTARKQLQQLLSNYMERL